MPLVPGYKYLGPGNSLQNGLPVNKLDAIAQAHDQSYANATNRADIIASDYESAKQMFNNTFQSQSLGEGVLSVVSGAALGAKAIQADIMNKLSLPNPLNYPTGTSNHQKIQPLTTEIEKVDESMGDDSVVDAQGQKRGVEEDGGAAKQVAKRSVGNAQGGGSGSHSGISSSGMYFPMYKNPTNRTTLTFNKTFFVTLPARNFQLLSAQLTTPKDLPNVANHNKIMVKQFVMPYFSIEPNALCWYLSKNELQRLRRQYAFAKIKDVSMVARQKTYRSVFEANSTLPALATSNAQHHVHVYRGIERVAGNMVILEDPESESASEAQNPITDYSKLCQKLYGTLDLQNGNAKPDWPATWAARELDYRLAFQKANQQLKEGHAYSHDLDFIQNHWASFDIQSCCEMMYDATQSGQIIPILDKYQPKSNYLTIAPSAASMPIYDVKNQLNPGSGFGLEMAIFNKRSNTYQQALTNVPADDYTSQTSLSKATATVGKVLADPNVHTIASRYEKDKNKNAANTQFNYNVAPTDYMQGLGQSGSTNFPPNPEDVPLFNTASTAELLKGSDLSLTSNDKLNDLHESNTYNLNVGLNKAHYSNPPLELLTLESHIQPHFDADLPPQKQLSSVCIGLFPMYKKSSLLNAYIQMEICTEINVDVSISTNLYSAYNDDISSLASHDHQEIMVPTMYSKNPLPTVKGPWAMQLYKSALSTSEKSVRQFGFSLHEAEPDPRHTGFGSNSRPTPNINRGGAVILTHPTETLSA